ncbi:SANT/Myb-like DNA-binding domain-containing protein [Streptomyces carpaticus]|uniref:SANT/Myb-like DNA-binding domain-containing protein n=1 Tax=Streptomyces carpaticus TaxID=285558 RepID=UPI002206055F|nr:SANT/Myb-like DNA-binding domain-containing protein [Streptomyces carpaticus]
MYLEEPRYAYMFGFLQMDGSLSSGGGNRGRLSLEVAHRDIHLLYAFQRLTPYYTSVRERIRETNFKASAHSAIWTLCSLEARTRLMDLGIPSGRKSHRVRPPTVQHAERDYWRGVIDADGSVGLTGRGLPFIALTSASDALALGFCAYVRALTNAERVPSRNARDGIFNLVYTKESAVALIQHLYYPGSLALERKQRSAAAAERRVRPTTMARTGARRRWSSMEDHRLIEAGNPESVAAELGRSPKACALRLWRLRSGELTPPG